MVALWINLLATIRLWRQRKRTRQLLAAFDDRMLKDIGLDRSEIGSAANAVSGSGSLFPSADFYRRRR